MTKKKTARKRMSTFQIIILGFIGVIILGALILMLPISSRNGVVTPFDQTLFTSTSAVCVTGLVVQDTATYWSLFGQVIILILIQIGGLGVINMVAIFAMLTRRRMSLLQRTALKDSISAPKMGGIAKLTGFVFKATAIIEGVGAAIMMPIFIRDFGLKGIWMAIFHSVSAFCNAGFDIMGTPDNKFASLTGFASDPLINIVVMCLIIVGGIGFMVWDDVVKNKFRFRKYRMQSKVVLVTSGLLILIPAVIFFFIDLSDLPIAERILGSLFQSVTTRTAGFNTVELPSLSRLSLGIFCMLMLIGGSPGSTAGGMKTTTIAVLLSNAFSCFRRKEDPEFFGRRIAASVVKVAATILLMYVSLCFGSAAIISTVEGLPLGVCIFETASAVGTVGLTLGITPHLSLLSRGILIVLMFLGRVGGLTIIYATISGNNKKLSKLPQEDITVG